MDKSREKKILIAVLVVVFAIFAILFVLLTTKDIEPEEVDERTPEEILIEEQTESLRIKAEEFEPLTDEDIESQTQKLDDLFNRMR